MSNKCTPEDFLGDIYGEALFSEDETVCVNKQTIQPDGNSLWWNIRHDHDVFFEFCDTVEAGRAAKESWYVCVSTVNGETNAKGTALKRGRRNIVKIRAVMLDDIGTKAETPPVEPAYKVESSAGNFQWVYALEPTEDVASYEALLDLCAGKKWTDGGAGGSYRVMRVPYSWNAKPGRKNFIAEATRCDVRAWELQELAEALGFAWSDVQNRAQEMKSGGGSSRAGANASGQAGVGGEFANPCPVHDPVYDWLVAQGMVHSIDYGRGWAEITCPWHGEHSNNSVVAAYSPLGWGGRRYEMNRNFKCLHEHRGRKKQWAEFETWLKSESGFSDWYGSEGGNVATVRGFDPLPVYQAYYVLVEDGRRVANIRARGKSSLWLHKFEEFGYANRSRVRVAWSDKPVWLATALMDDRATQRVRSVVYRPAQPEFTTDGGEGVDGLYEVLNEWTPPNWKKTSSKPEVLLKFFEFLYPEPGELEIFLDWLAFKIQNPDKRSFALVNVTEAFGVGRGTVEKIVRGMLQGKEVSNASLGDLIGKGVAAKQNFNDWQARTQFVFVDEAKDVAREDFFSGYEKFKEIVDPATKSFESNKKFGAMQEETRYFNVFIASNHLDALCIPEGDRRICVLANPAERADEAFYEEVLKAAGERGGQGELGELYWWLMNRQLSDGFSPVYPPMTPAKEAMIRSSVLPSDAIHDFLVEHAPGDLVTWGSMLNGLVQEVCKELGLPVEKCNVYAKQVWAKLDRGLYTKHGWRVRDGNDRHHVRLLRGGYESWGRQEDEGPQEAVRRILEDIDRNLSWDVAATIYDDLE